MWASVRAVLAVIEEAVTLVWGLTIVAVVEGAVIGGLYGAAYGYVTGTPNAWLWGMAWGVGCLWVLFMHPVLRVVKRLWRER